MNVTDRPDRDRPAPLRWPVVTVAAVVMVALVPVACAGSDTAVTGTGTVDTAVTETATSGPAVTGTGTSDPDPVATVPVVAVSTTDPPPEPVEYDLGELPALIAGLDDTVTTTDPLELARAIGGFPYEIAVPDGSVLARVDTSVWGDGDIVDHEFSYSVVAPDGTVPDIDITADDNGPGSVQVTDIWDPVMAGLGFRRTASTASDPGEPGGPNSVNHVYSPGPDTDTVVNGVPAVAGNVFVWSDEDITGASSGLDPGDPVGGYRIDVDAETSARDPIAVPLSAAIAARVPLPDGAVLERATVRLQSRRPDSFDIERGARYVTVSFEWSAPARWTVDRLGGFYTGDGVFADPALVAARPSFFDEGTFERSDLEPYGDSDARLALLLADRFPGTVRLEAPDSADDPVTISVDITLDSNAVELTPGPDWPGP